MEEGQAGLVRKDGRAEGVGVWELRHTLLSLATWGRDGHTEYILLGAHTNSCLTHTCVRPRRVTHTDSHARVASRRRLMHRASGTSSYHWAASWPCCPPRVAECLQQELLRSRAARFKGGATPPPQDRRQSPVWLSQGHTLAPPPLHTPLPTCSYA